LPEVVEGDNITGAIRMQKRSIPEGCKILTLELANEIALANNPDFISTKHAMTAAWARFYQSLSAYLPTISGDYSIGDVRTNPGYQRKAFAQRNYSYDNTVGIQGQWLIFDGLMRTMNMLAARHSAKEEEALVDDAHRLLIESVANAFNNIMLSKEQIRIAQNDLDFQKKMLNESQIKYDAGAVALTDVLNFKIKVNDAENALIIAEYSLRTAKYVLAELMGITDCDFPEDLNMPLISNIHPAALTDVGVYLDTALSNRPDLEAYRQALEVAKYNLYSTYGSFSPTVSATFGYQYNWNRTSFKNSRGGAPEFTSLSRTRTFNYGGNVEWVIFNDGQRFAEVREAQAVLAQQEYKLVDKWLTVISEVRQSHDDYVKNSKQLILFQNIQKLVNQNRDLVEEEYKAGNTSITRLNEAQRDLIEAESNLASAMINVLNSKAQLEASVGEK